MPGERNEVRCQKPDPEGLKLTSNSSTRHNPEAGIVSENVRRYAQMMEKTKSVSGPLDANVMTQVVFACSGKRVWPSRESRCACLLSVGASPPEAVPLRPRRDQHLIRWRRLRVRTEH
jgi:hypothetical protein